MTTAVHCNVSTLIKDAYIIRLHTLNSTSMCKVYHILLDLQSDVKRAFSLNLCKY